MAGISVPQYEVFKLNSNKLKTADWDITISKAEAYMYQEIVSLFEGQQFRLIANKIIKQPIDTIDFSQVFLQVVVDRKTDFARITSKKGIKVNGETFRRFVGTTGGLKNNILTFCNIKYLDELNRLCECGRDLDLPLVPAKYEAYKALTCSASQPICNPKRILVVSDVFCKHIADVVYLDNSDDTLDEPVMKILKDRELENNATDGFNLCTINYMQRVGESLGLDYTPRGVCLRNAWLKGMMYPFPILEFVEKYGGGNYIVKDIWGNDQDLRECEMILTESSLKLWKAYKSIDDYMQAYEENGYQFSITKISSHELDQQRLLNYQYLQSYELTDEDIAELCDPTIEFLQKSMGADYESALNFLGLINDPETISWQKALFTSEYMLGDPYVIDNIHRYIKKKVDEAKIGKLFVDGNYEVASGDPFILMQHICGLETTGLLKANECYSKFWIDKNVDELVIMRSPMTSHENIRKCRVNNSDECQYWYQYMDTVMIINSWDCFCMAENGCD